MLQHTVNGLLVIWAPSSYAYGPLTGAANFLFHFFSKGGLGVMKGWFTVCLRLAPNLFMVGLGFV